ncbi:MAG: leucyl/phenylalanyl-tRNA--protein transferase [Chitinophagales bacterium]|nr:leucyl/phenylalanyl-tRNA--protein transferase [Chitinophagales bacterium]
MVYLTQDNWFPDPDTASEDGLLAIGGDLNPDRLLLAYSKGIFPWFMKGRNIYWYSPANRMVLFSKEIHVGERMERTLRSKQFAVTVNQNFKEVIHLCAETHFKKHKDTWITAEFIEAYIILHQLGHARSIEIWHKEKLVGGIYGVITGKLFCGESMFSIMSNASKAAIIYLCRRENYMAIDCQVPSHHLSSLGARIITRAKFEQLLMNATK